MPDELSLYGALLGEQGGGRVGRLLEGMLTCQVASALARLGVPDQLAGGPRTAAEIAPQVGAAAGALGRLLAAAAAYGLVSQDGQGRFALTPDGELLRTDVDGSVRALAIGFFGPPIWASFGRIVEVGGSRGTLLSYLLRAVPDATGVLLDRPEALAAAPGYLAQAGVAGRVELVPGDFLREVPPGDLHVLCHTLHNWDDEYARTIIGNCARASHPGAGLMVIDQVLPDGPEPSVAHLMDLIMMLALGGRERTRAEHEALTGPAGYTLVRETPVTDVLPWRVLEFEFA